ncbi:adenylate/guanylate cyclase domain-containing protein [Bradyrhizobium erythrophlei]|uniref:adenylate/guanylate cyclase domain-containing protein n=1 Tax=Bradyrhizobium erythrophlei TaxID=1437360 RepID=UPI0035E8B762
MSETRKLAAILAADVVGFSRLAAIDEDRTLARLRALRSEVIDPVVAVHRGRVVKRTGDGAIVEFRSAVDAVRCAVEIQTVMVERNTGVAADQRIDFRIGIHIGDVVEEADGDLMGDGVNIAARLESVAAPGGISISEDAWRQVSGKVNATFVDRGETRLKNIPRPIRVYSIDLGRRSAGPLESVSPSSSDTPSIAVLPFQNMSGDAEQDYFCDGLVEDIVTTFSKLAGLRVIARNSTFLYKGKSVDVREVAQQLGARYVLEGSVRKSGHRIRVTAQLIDAKDGSHIWAERYDRAVEDIFAIQDEITLVLATDMQVKLTEGEQARLHYTTTCNVEAWSLWTQGLSLYRQAVSKDNMGRALALWQKALALDPSSAPLNAMVGFAHCADARFGWWDDRSTALRKTWAYTAKALQLDSDNPDAHTAASIAHMIQGQFDDAVLHARRAVEVAPGSADAAVLACFVLASAGYAHEAVPLIEKAMMLSPHYPANYLGHLGNVYRLTGQFEKAISAFKAFDARSSGFGLTDLVIAYQQTDQPELAKETAKRLHAVRPTFTVRNWLNTQFRRDEALLEAEANALRAAGLPDG